jgi:hypothetical protein
MTNQPQPRDSPERWWDTVDWWTDPRLAFAAGMTFGYQLRADEEAITADQVQRAAVQRVARIIQQADARATHDHERERAA